MLNLSRFAAAGASRSSGDARLELLHLLRGVRVLAAAHLLDVVRQVVGAGVPLVDAMEAAGMVTPAEAAAARPAFAALAEGGGS